MAISRNHVEVMGYLGADPVLSKYDGFHVLVWSVGVSTKWRTKAGEQKEHTEWVRCVLKDQLRDGEAKRIKFLSGALKKGSPVFVEGALRSRTYDKDGVLHWTCELLARDVQLLAKPPSSGRPRDDDYEHLGSDDLIDDDIPF